jgi:hypothetical protein
MQTVAKFHVCVSIIVLLAGASSAAARYAGGAGTREDPYQIATAADLIALGASPGDYDKHFVLTADIDLDPNLPGRRVFQGAVIAPDADDESWGFDGTPFTGVFDGKGHSLAHLSLVGSMSMGGGYVGLFGKLGSGGKIVNLGVEAVDVNAAEGHIGPLVAYSQGCIALSRSEDCRIRGSGTVGGLVGANAGSIAASYSTGSITGNYAGGLVGMNYSSIVASYSTCTIVNGRYAGGLAGEDYGTIVASYSTGAVNGDEYAGGLVGQTSGDNSITMCYSTGAVTGRQWRGGLVAGHGEYGENWVVASFWDTETSGRANSAGGVGLETLRMQDIDTFRNAGWDLVREYGNGRCEYWEMKPGEYPRLRYHTGAGPVMPEGAGTAQQPYVIRDARDLGTVWFEPRACYCLAGHVELEGDTWSAAAIPWFGGTFDGRGFAFRHFCARGGPRLGLFGELTSGATISNLGLDGAQVSGTGAYVGGLVGDSQGTIRNCYSVGGVIDTLGAVPRDDDCVGGLVGLNGGRIADSRSSGVVTGNGAGGLAGYNRGWIDKSYSAGTVNGGNNVGGLVGSHTGRITVSHSTCTVRGGVRVGGLVGRFPEDEECELSECFSTGAVYGVSHVGGLVGSIDEGEVSQCYSTGAVGGSVGVGGLVGRNSMGTLWRCYSAGAVQGDLYVGGLVGELAQTEIDMATDCLWDIEASGQATSGGGTGKTTAQMQDVNTFLDAGWDLAGETANGTCDYWEIMPGAYPQFRCYAGKGPVMPEGAGTAEQPYLIRDARDLGNVWFEPEAHYRLAQSVDLAGSTWSLAVVPWFGGTFDGAGHVISNLRIRGRDCVGLFGRLRGAKVTGLGLEAVDVNGIGAVGGLAGDNFQGSISVCYSTGIVQGSACVGGLAGGNGGSIAASYSAGTVTGDWDVGGLVGATGGRIAGSYSAGTVTGGQRIGGLAGTNTGEIGTSYSTCTVRGGASVGGLVGLNYSAAHIAMSYSAGTVAGDKRVGGLVGENYIGATASASFWDRETSGQAASTEGTGKTTAEMQTAATFLDAGWDFLGETANGTEDTWWLDEGKDYPHLWWELSETAGANP